MFENIGEKIKKLATILCWVGIVVSIIAAIVMFASVSDAYYASERTARRILGFVWLIVGPLSSWISSFFMYGFGELVENSSDISYYAHKIANNDNKKPSKDEQLKILLNAGLITQEEYDAKTK